MKQSFRVPAAAVIAALSVLFGVKLQAVVDFLVTLGSIPAN